MAGVKDVERKIQGLIDECNQTTGGTATTLSAAVRQLAEYTGQDMLLGDLYETENGAYAPGSYGCEAFSGVTVDVAIPPEYIQLPALSNPAQPSNVEFGMEYIDENGTVQMGCHECSVGDAGLAFYFADTLKVDASVGTNLNMLLTQGMPLWREIMKTAGAEQNYMPMTIATNTNTADIFNGAWYAGDGDTEYSYVGHNLMGGSTLKIGYDTTGGKVTKLSLTVDGTAQPIPLGGINAMFAFFWPVAIE